MILGMIRKFMLPVMLSGAMWAQVSQVPKIRVVFPEGHSEKAWVTYGLHDPARNNWHVNYGASMQAGQTSFEIQAETDRFKAVGWAPGYEMKQFDVTVEKSDVQLWFILRPSQYGLIPWAHRGHPCWKRRTDFGCLPVNRDPFLVLRGE
jgi:hypothetical protein